MALHPLRLRRALSVYSTLINRHSPLSSPPAISLSSQKPTLDPTQPRHLIYFPFQSRQFRSSAVSLSSRPRSQSWNRDAEEDKIGPDTILFEGCDYNHWLITMDFPKDPKPTPEEMVETYVQTAAKVVGSVEEAKKKIYACSTSTYNGFQVEVSEEVSEKFKGLPGVVFVLPDSYIDPVNKEYGGDKYINGTIIPRPPPVQYGRNRGRYGDRNREFDRPNHPRGSGPYDNQGAMHGDTRNSGPQQNYGPPGAGERRDPMPMNNASGGWNNYQGDRRDPMTSHQSNYNQGERGNYYPQGQRDFQPGHQRGYAPPGQGDFRGDSRNYAPTQGGTYGQGSSGTHGQGSGGTYGQGAGGTYGQGAGGTYGQGAGGTYGQGAGGTYGQGAGGAYRQGGGGSQGQGVGVAYGQGGGGNYGQGGGAPHGQGASGTNGQGVGGAPHGQGASGTNGQGVGGATHGQGASGAYGQGVGGAPHGQGASGTYGQGVGGAYGQGGGAPHGQGASGTYGQGVGGAYYGQGGGAPRAQGASGIYGQGGEAPHGQGASATYGQETGFGFGQSYQRHGDNQRIPQMETEE